MNFLMLWMCIASAVLGEFADIYGIEAIYDFCAYMPLLGIIAVFLPDLHKARRHS